MFRNYPLTTLFIVATICVDLAIILTVDAGSVLAAETGLRFYVWNYAIPAQFSTLALWAVFGKTHRLTKAAWVTLASGMLLMLTWHTVEPAFRGESISFNLIQLFTVSLGSALFRLCGIGKQDRDAPSELFQFSLVEIFGWTMIVALWAFAMRFAGVDFLIDKYLIVWIVAASLAPLLLVPVLFGRVSTGWRLLGFLGVYIVTFAAYGVSAKWMDGPLPLWAFSMAITQITYISAWWAVVRMDEVMQERRAVIASSEQKLALYDPQES
ncbi:MAG: hypothetical protein SH868_02260 [Bythopirellula sp.]|nr:hypothetical protein [Bythopirellula sp.]